MTRSTFIIALSFIFTGCRQLDCEDNDQDCDGYADDVDCNDADPDINPGATDYCDDYIDSNCDGVDGYVEDAVIYYRDADGDGYGNPDYPSVKNYCGLPNNYVVDNTDCDDHTPLINPEAIEICDGLDNNCDGEIDEDCPVDTGDSHDE